MLKLPFYLILLAAFAGQDTTIAPSQQNDLQREGMHGQIKTITMLECNMNKWNERDTGSIVITYNPDGYKTTTTHYNRQQQVKTGRQELHGNTRYTYSTGIGIHRPPLPAGR